VPAFPGAEGFGAAARGGRGGKVYQVTTLEDYGRDEQPIPGSLRAAVEAEGPRIVVFGVSGTLDLKRRLDLLNPFITIAGQTAPGDGICLKRFGMKIQTQEVIVRHLRVRPGDLSGKELDGIWVRRAKNVILDHCSVGWAIDECLSSNQGSDLVTLQWCTLADALHNSVHSKGNHGYGGLASGIRLTVHHCLYANNRSRNPRAGGKLLDFRNNVIYDWNGKAGYTGNTEHYLNYVANYLKAGPSTLREPNIAFWGGPKSRIYVAGNYFFGRRELTKDNARMINLPAGVVLAKEPFVVPPVKTDSAERAYKRVLAGVGATKPKRDSVDAALVESVRNGTGKLIDSQTEAGGWPELKSASAPRDSDADGMPDKWEKRHGLNPDNASDANFVGPDGYTNIERYVNALADMPR
jgi:pectate lyase